MYVYIYACIYIFTIVMSNNTPETMTRQQRYHRKIKEMCIERSRRCYEENKKDYKR